MTKYSSPRKVNQSNEEILFIHNMFKLNKIKFFLLFFFTSQMVNSQIKIIRLQFSYTLQEGRGVEMFYLNDDLEQIISSISSMKTFDEAEFLSAFGIPLVDTNYSKCESEIKNQNNSDFFKKSFKKHISTKELEINIEVSNVDLRFCEFPLEEKYWNSYYVKFEKARMITKIVQYLDLKNVDINKVKILSKILKNKF